MPTDRHSLLRQHFEAAQALDLAGRSALLGDLKRGDPALAQELIDLLDAAAIPSVLDAPMLDLASQLSADQESLAPEIALPQKLGRFTLTGVLGRGGQGVVYRATQSQPAREVAVKVITAAALSPGLARRFAHEAEALAMLTHPGIAQIFDAGTEPLAGTPCPYIAMELIEGHRLSEHVRRAGLSTRQIATLLIEVAGSVDYAHKRGVIHRDLKPGNILVTPEGHAKVLDFGVARMIRDPGSPLGPRAETMNATGQQIVGTLAYMSPEQAAGDAALVDSRSDVYALGAIAYELFCGQPPRLTDSMSIPAALRAIAETDVPPPRSVIRTLPQEVEAIVLKALARRPEDRYQHASAFADDLARFLAGEAVSAKMYTTVEMARRFVRRHRLPVAAAVCVLLALTGGFVTTAWQAAVARRERESARQEAASARASAAMIRRILSAAAPEEARGQDVTVRQMLTAAEAELAANQDGEDPAVADIRGKPAESGPADPPDAYALATTLTTLAETRYALGDYALAEKHARRAMAFFDETPRARSESAILNRIVLARTLTQQDHRTEAMALADSCVALAVEHLGPAHPVAFEARFARIFSSRPTTRAERLAAIEQHRVLLADMQAVLPANDPRINDVREDLAVDLEEVGDRKEAFRIACEVYAWRKRNLGHDHPLTLASLHNVATYTGEIGKLPPAIMNLTTVIEGRTRVLGPQHPSTLQSLATRAQFSMRRGDFIGALADTDAVLAGRIAQFGADHRRTAQARGLRATCLLNLKRIDEAGPEIDSLLAHNQRVFGLRDDATLMARTLAWDLAEARNDAAGMTLHANALIGSEYEAPVREQMKIKNLPMD